MVHSTSAGGPSLPDYILTYAREYRLASGAPWGGLAGCAFMAKPTADGGYERRTVDTYVGIYVLRGRARYTDHHGVSCTVTAGDFLQLPPGLPHSVMQEGDGQWVEAWFTIRQKLAVPLAETGVIQWGRTVLKPGLHLNLLVYFEHIQDELFRADAAGNARAVMMIQKFLLDVYAYDAASGPPDAHQQMVDELCQLLSQNLRQRIDLPELAAKFPLSYERLRKIFRERTGYSLADFRIRKRIELARTLLEHQQLPVKQVARELGYPDPFTFSRQFRKFTGQTPSALLQSRGIIPAE